MSTTRHLVNRRRRLAARPAPGTARSTAATPVRTGTTATGPDRKAAPKPDREAAPKPGSKRGSKPDRKSPSRAVGRLGRLGRLIRLPRRLPALCAVLTLACGGFTGWAATEAQSLRDTASARNTALADAARTSEVKGEVTSAVNALFSYDHAEPEKNERAARRLLTGRAVEQHRALLARVRAQDSGQKHVLTTTVTDSAVTTLEGDRARVLLFADQHSARTAANAKGEDGAKDKSGTKDESGAKDKGGGGEQAKDDNATYAGAMLAVNAVRKDGAWRIAAIDTLS
ncbi:hypothetical protein ACFW4X_04120 [Streptomyces smyrnaeus]|uniref:hypothetical protein n=1 Tax=Streptomyces smyrnaeus TaxID=1387713 RepID=UPI0036C7EF0F